MIDRCWLGEVANRRIGQLSKGYRQRVGLAASLLHDPAILILDEPTNGLDPSQIREMRSLVKDLARSRTVLVSSHILPEVEKTCDRVLVIARGRLRADGTPAELVARHTRSVDCLAEVPAASEPAAAAAVRSVPGVASLASEPVEPGWVRLRAGSTDDLRERIARSLAVAGIVCRDLRRDAPTLEQVFVSLIEEEATAVGASDRGEGGA